MLILIFFSICNVCSYLCIVYLYLYIVTSNVFVCFTYLGTIDVNYQ